MDYLIFTMPVVLIFLWMETDALVEYCLKLKIPLLYAKEFWDFKKETAIFYPDFLVFKNNCFSTRLLSCNYCLSVVLNILFYIFLNHGFNLLVLSTNIILGWAVYALLTKVIKWV
jgi:hypothetical protein